MSVSKANSVNPPNYEELKAKEILKRGEVLSLLGILRPILWKWEKEVIIKKHRIEGKVFFKFSEICSAMVEISP